jgi:hypothetical protein
MEIKLNFTLV